MLCRKCIRIFAVFCVWLVYPSNESGTQSLIKIEGNGYTGISVGISSNVKEDIHLIDRVKTVFTKSSQLLYQATRYRLYFKEIDIHIPKTWSQNATFRNVTGTKFENIPIRIDLPSLFTSGPLVFGQTICNGLGQYMHLTPQQFSSYNTHYGTLDKEIVHKWGLLRFGVFEESPSIRKEGSNQRFYMEEGTWKPVRCTDEIEGFMSTNCSDKTKKCTHPNGKPERSCRFCINRKETKAKASLMGFPWIPTVNEFCDTDDPNTPAALRHTNHSISRQNHYCNGQSIWEVLKGDFDFKVVTPGPPNQNTDPTFRLFHEMRELIVVLVLDVSGSMSGVPIQKLREAAKGYLLDTAPNGTWIGIVEFHDYASTSHKMTQITSDSTRQSLVNALPTSAGGSTSIGAGLQEGYLMILENSYVTNGSIILLVTDGKENTSPYIKDIEPVIRQDGIKVHTLAYGRSADPGLEDLVMATGGDSYFYTGFDISSGINDVFDNLVTTEEPILRIYSSTIVLKLGMAENITFYVDSNNGRDIKVRLSLPIMNVDVKLLIETPSGKVFHAIYTNGSDDGVPFIELHGENEPGEYQIQICTDYNLELRGTVQVTSKLKHSSSTYDAVKLTGWPSNFIFDISGMKKISLHASVQKRYAPVVHANISAQIEDGDGYQFDVTLNDDGIGSDLEENDGIYSASILFTKIRTNGRHFIKVAASNLEGRAKLLVRDEDQSDDYDTVYREQEVERFLREKVIDSFSVNSFTSQVNPDDTIPPSKITTLYIQSYSLLYQTFTLEWKAPGDDFEYGQVSDYDIRIADAPHRLRQDPDSEQRIVMTSKPKMAGEIETLTIQPNISKENVTYYIGIRGIDERNNYGEMSNILSISVITEKQWLEDAEAVTEAVIVEQNDSLSELNIIIIIVAIALMLLLFIVLVISFVLLCKRCEKQVSTQSKEFQNNAYDP